MRRDEHPQDLRNLGEFLKMFKAEFNIINREDNPKYVVKFSPDELFRLLDILKSKGYYHDDDYRYKMCEEDVILSNPELKELHDRYKMLLYIVMNSETF